MADGCQNQQGAMRMKEPNEKKKHCGSTKVKEYEWFCKRNETK